MIHELSNAIEQATTQYYRLVLLVGGHASAKTKLLQHLAETRKLPYVRLSLQISKDMLAMTSSQRRTQVDGLVKELVANADGDVVLLDTIEVLFCRSLQVDPLRVLQGASRNSVVVAAWAGAFDGTTLTYGEPDHPEHRAYEFPGAIVVTVNSPRDKGLQT